MTKQYKLEERYYIFLFSRRRFKGEVTFGEWPLREDPCPANYTILVISKPFRVRTASDYMVIAQDISDELLVGNIHRV